MAEAAGVSEKTIQQAKRAHEAGLGEDVRDGKVTAKDAAQIAKLPEPERRAAIEAPKEEKPKAPVKAEDPQELVRLKAENEDLKERLDEMATLMTGLQEELEAARRILDAEDLAAQFAKEVKRAQAQANVTQARNNGLMNENADLTKRLKSALKKIERLEKGKE